jgi:DNA topoisomerase-2
MSEPKTSTPKSTKATSSNGAIEKMYQKKTPLEHILLRPDTYIGSVEFLMQEMWIWDFENERMIKKEIKFVPGLFKIFDEILGNDLKT